MYTLQKGQTLTNSIEYIADDCLASVFRLLDTVDRNSCSLVCRRWLKVDGYNRHSLSLTAESHLSDFIPSLFLRFNTVTEVSLRYFGYEDETISAETLIRISQLCPNLTSLQVLASCFLTAKTSISSPGIAGFEGKLQLKVQILGGGGRNEGIYDHLQGLWKDLSLDGFRGTENASSVALPKLKLKAISLKDTVLFYPFLGAKNLRVLKLVRCHGDLNTLFHVLTNEVTGIVELHLVMLEISDIGLEAIAKCSNLEVLHLTRTPKCTDKGLVAVAKGCNRSLRKLRVGWDMEEIGSRGLMGVAEYCVNVEQLVLIGVNPSKECLEMLVSNCKGLKQLAVCGSETVG
ncbi:putative F-box/LRR-repeat protein 8 [Vigna umbellata]|uniref:putative F-box/LRR-repeat protein 8 n=1 Tax=Vigna umbellata TaxID=87088 RepID=UPI001F5F04D9|nr:putative F-box/LRR-repeat protein 8 [Vigna umbellata]